MEASIELEQVGFRHQHSVFFQQGLRDAGHKPHIRRVSTIETQQHQPPGLSRRAAVDALPVTRAAERMEMSQPGMSSALCSIARAHWRPAARARSGHEFVLTERAQALALKVRHGLEPYGRDLRQRRRTGPVEDAGHRHPRRGGFLVSTARPRSIKRTVRATAPELVRSTSARLTLTTLLKWLSEGECDIAIGYFPEVHPSTCARSRSTRANSVLHLGAWAVARRLMEVFTRRPHVVLAPSRRAPRWSKRCRRA